MKDAQRSGHWSWLAIGATIAIALVFQQFADVFATITAVLIYEAHSGNQVMGNEGGTHAIAGLITALTGFVYVVALLPFIGLMVKMRESKALCFLGYLPCSPTEPVNADETLGIVIY